MCGIACMVAANILLARLQTGHKRVQYVPSNMVVLGLGAVAADAAKINYAVALYLQQTLLPVIDMCCNVTMILLPPSTNL